MNCPEKCPRGLSNCKPYGHIGSNIGEEKEQSFFCCGKNDGTMSQIPEDIYTLCFKGEFRDNMSFNDRRDLVDTAQVIITALSNIELDMLETASHAKLEAQDG